MTSDFHASNFPMRYDPILNRLLERMPPHIADSFTEEQLSAFQVAMTPANRHKVNIRLSIPLLHKRFYVVFLAGPEKRSPLRRLAERQPIWTPGNAIFLGLLLASCVVTLFNVFYLVNAVMPQVSATESYPTALPWIESEAQCKGGTRVWKNGFCFDADHSPEF